MVSRRPLRAISAIALAWLACLGESAPWDRHAEAAEAIPPRIIWIPAWGISLRESIDVLHAYGVYYRYLDSQWYTAASPDGPWTAAPGLSGTSSGGRPRQVIRPRPHAPPSIAAVPRDSENAWPHRAPHLEASRIVDLALEHLGAPYVWGGASPAGFDCSGLISYVYAQVGIALPHNAAQQFRHGVPVARDELQPGDLVFFDGLRHNGLYIGDGRFIHAARSEKSIVISNLDERWYGNRWVGARRLLVTMSIARRD